MKQSITARNSTDENGAPAGGSAIGAGIRIHWEEDPLNLRPPTPPKHYTMPNWDTGATVEGVLQAALIRLEFLDGFGANDLRSPAQAAMSNIQDALKNLEAQPK